MKSLAITLFICLSPLISMAQVQFKLESFDQDKLIKSLDEVIYVVRQEYAVRGPDSLLYGNNGNSYYDAAFGPAVMFKGKLILNKFTYFPYLKDTSFRSLGQNYIPEPTKTMYKKISDSTFTIWEQDSLEVTTKKHSVHIPRDDSAAISHERVAKIEPTMDCVVITFLSSDSTLTKSSLFEQSFVNTTVSWNTDGVGTLGEQDLGIKTHFGLLFYEHTGYGSAFLSFGGFVEKNSSGEWQAMQVQQPIIERKPVTPKETVPNKKGKKKKGKKGKN